MTEKLYNKVYGCLIGGAVGDALGGPVEGCSYQEIRKKYGKVEEFEPFTSEYGKVAPGHITDDSVLRHYMCLTIIEKGGRITPDDFAKTWKEKVNPDRLWLNERIIYNRIRVGINPWVAGEGCVPAGCASMAIAPIGIINAGDPAQAYQDGFNIAFVNQKGNNRDFAASFAAACATAFLPEVTVKDIISTMYQYSTSFSKRALDLTLELAYDSENVDEFVEKFYNNMLDWSWVYAGWDKDNFHKGKVFSGNSFEFVPVVAAILHLCQDDINQAIIEGASFGRDCDTIASLVGNVAGIMQGASAIRSDWIDDCEKANQEFFEETEGDKGANFSYTASRMTEALKSELKNKKEILDIQNKICE